MEKINIEIPTGLTPKQEAILIAKELGKTYLPHGVKMIGNYYELKNLQTTITINRKIVEAVTVTCNCPVCSCIFDRKLSKICYTNVGGTVRQKRLCGNECRDFYISIAPNRISAKKADVSNYMFYRR